MRYIGVVLAVIIFSVVVRVAGAEKTEERGSSHSEKGLLHVWGRTRSFGVETFTLDNGLQVVTLSIPGSDQVTYMVWYKVGAADDLAGKSGLAHLVEHTTFRGGGAQVEPEMGHEAHHSTPEVDAFTSYDYTAYAHVVPTERLETAMHIEANRMAALAVTDDALALEQAEIFAERGTEITDVPEARFDAHLRTALYGTHPYGRLVLGSPEEEQRLTTHDANNFYHTWYSPNNALLIIAGDITAARLAPLVQRHYGSLPARPVPARSRPPVPAPPGGQRLVIQDTRVREPLWKRMYVAPSYHAGATQHVYALQVLRELLAGESAGRLFHQLVVKHRLATSIGVDYLPDSVGLTDFTVYAIPAPGVQVRALATAIDRTLAAVVEGVSHPEVKRAQRRLRRQAPLARQHGHAGAELLGMALATGRTLAAVAAWQERIAAVTPEQVQAASQAVLREARSVTGVLLPATVGDTASSEGGQNEKP